MKVFIGGSKMINSFTDEFVSELDEICSEGNEILIGDCFGVDSLVQKYLTSRGYTNVKVYVSGDKVRCNHGDFPVVHIDVPDGISGFKMRRQKDSAMAESADYGLMLWDGKSRGTYSNIEDLRRRGKRVKVYETVAKRRVLGD